MCRPCRPSPSPPDPVVSGLSNPSGSGFGGAYGFNGGIHIGQNHGFRAFRYDLNDRLGSLVYDYEWQPGVNRAVCARDTLFEKDPKPCPFPSKACSHGFYAYYGEDYFQPHWAKKVCILNGVIDGFGRCVIGDKGYRSEYATLVAFCKPFRVDTAYCEAMDMEPELIEQHVCRQLEQRFPQVPIFDSVAELRNVIPLPGRPPRNAA